MKIQLDKEKFTDFEARLLQLLPTILVILFVGSFAVLSFIALYPRQNDEIVAEGQKRLDSLNIRFNTKLLDELSATKQPAQLNANGGRDPFSSF